MISACGLTCQNGGSLNADCSMCECPPGFTGSSCLTDIDECTPNPCQNGGTCIDGSNSFACQCPPGHIGMSCETIIEDCSSTGCENGGASSIDRLNILLFLLLSFTVYVM